MTWVGMPVDIVERLERLGLTRDDRLLYVEGFLYAGQYLTDGTVTARLPRLSDHPDADAAAARLVDAQVWEHTDDGAYVIVDYFTANLTREEVTRRKEDARLRQERSRRHKAGDHSICIRGRYCPDGQSETVTRDVTRENTRESQDTYLPDLPDLQGKGREGKESAGDDGRGSPKGSPTPASPHEATSAQHIYADPQRVGHCCHCGLPARNAVHHPGAPDVLQLLADVATDLGPMTPTRIVNTGTDSWWKATATDGQVTWNWDTSDESDDNSTIDSIEFVIPLGLVPDLTNEQWEELQGPCDRRAAESKPPLKWGAEDDGEGGVFWRLSTADYRVTVDVTKKLPMARQLLQLILDAGVKP
jgi:hypothetical protein